MTRRIGGATSTRRPSSDHRRHDSGLAFARVNRQPFLRWADAGAPELFAMQAVAPRLFVMQATRGNFFNQELHGSPTNLPWAVSDKTEPRVTPAPRPRSGGDAQPTLPGAVPVRVGLEFPRADHLISLARRFEPRFARAKLLLTFFAWCGSVRQRLARRLITRVAPAGGSRPCTDSARHAACGDPAPPSRAITRVPEGRATRVPTLPSSRGAVLADPDSLR